MAGGLDFGFCQLYILPLKLPRVQKRMKGVHTLKVNHLQSCLHIHNPSLETNALVINESAYDRLELWLAFVHCSKECPLLMTTAVGLITPEKIIKFLHISQKQMEELQKGSSIWENILDSGSSKERPEIWYSSGLFHKVFACESPKRDMFNVLREKGK